MFLVDATSLLVIAQCAVSNHTNLTGENKMSEYKCTVRFEKRTNLPDFSINLTASDEKSAITESERWARGCGYIGTIKAIDVREIDSVSNDLIFKEFNV